MNLLARWNRTAADYRACQNFGPIYG